MLAITKQLSHDEARTLEAVLIRRIVAKADMDDLIDGTEPIAQQLQKAGIDNLNRGRVEFDAQGNSRWKQGVNEKVDRYVNWKGIGHPIDIS